MLENLLSSPFGGILGIIHVVAIIWAIINILSSSMPVLHKVIWFVIVAALPIVGLIIYLLVGRKA